MRAFVAIFPPREIQEALHRSAQEIAVDRAIRLVRPENVHLTIKFLGEVPREVLTSSGDALAAVAGRHKAFEIGLSNLGAFPSEQRGRVLWAGVSRGSEYLGALSGDVEKALEQLGLDHETRTYRPHVTLGRARSGSFSLDQTTKSHSLDLDFQAGELLLVESVLRRTGAEYEPVGVYPLSREWG